MLRNTKFSKNPLFFCKRAVSLQTKQIRIIHSDVKRIAFPCLCLLLLAVTSCQREKVVRSALARAEAVMEENPGAAREILDSLAYPQPLPKGKGVWSPRLQEGMGEASFALYALLRTQAEHKCHVRAKSDSLPLIATRYYGTKRKTQRAALAQHYLGCASRASGQNCMASLTCRSSSTESVRYMDDWFCLCLCSHAGLWRSATEKSGCAYKGV